MMRTLMKIAALALTLMLAGLPAAAEDVRELKWEDLVPKGWDPLKEYKKLGIEKMKDGDPRAEQALARLRASWDNAPVVETLNGVKVKLPGYVVMLEADQQGVKEFLLVPYFGACIHVPPPPANQLVHVFAAKLVPEKVAMFPVYVTGVLETVHADTEYGSAGYRIAAAHVEAYPVK